MESSGGMVGETATLLSSLCGVIDRHEGLLLGCTWQECQIRLAIDLHRGLHGACSKQLTKEVPDGALQGASAAFHTSSCIRSSLTCLALQSHFPPVYDLWHSQHPELMYI